MLSPLRTLYLLLKSGKHKAKLYAGENMAVGKINVFRYETCFISI